ncbi:MAG TPA: autotransporter-associated beta strand repeat-containing protein, partial [Luteolibacter sp.]
ILMLGANNQLTAASLVTFDHAFSSQHAYFKLNGFNTSIAGLQNGGADLGGEVLNGATANSILTLAGTGTYTFGPTNGYHGTISDGPAGTLGITKSGSGTQTFTGANTYTGPTTIEGGTLAITGSLGNTAVEVKSSAKLTVAGNLGGAVTIRSNGHLAFALAATSGAQPVRTVGGALTLDTGNIIDLTSSATPAAGEYLLATAASISGTPGTVNLPVGVNGTVVVVGNSLRLTISAPGYATWISNYNAAGQTTPNADADQDGLPNAVEFVLGTTPTTVNSSPVMNQKSGENMVVTFNRLDDSETGTLQLSVEAGSTLSPLSQVYQIGATNATSSSNVNIVENGAAPDTVTVTIPTSGSPCFFTRLKVVITP